MIIYLIYLVSDSEATKLGTGKSEKEEVKDTHMQALSEEPQDKSDLTKEDKDALMKFETLNNQEIDFDKAKVGQKKKNEFRRVPVPLHRYTPLKHNWETILKTLVKHMKLLVRMNTRRRAIEIKTTKEVRDCGTIQKAADFLKAFMLGFELQDAVAILRLEDLHIQTFEIKDVKILRNDHLPRCIGRICGEKGKTKNAVENATRTRIVVADTRIHILGSFANIQYAKSAV
jgi:RNA-binding protein PNO1